MKPNSAGPLVVCRNGECTRPAEYGRHRWCLRCWAGMKWTSIRQRVENKNGNNPHYQGVPLHITKEELIAWVMENPPPHGMAEPSIDRIVPELGYAAGNIRWLEKNRNAANVQRDVPDGMKLCAGCKQVLPETEFGPYNGKPYGKKLQPRCRPCKRKYLREWSAKRRGL